MRDYLDDALWDPKACRCVRPSCAWRRSTRRCCLIHGDSDENVSVQQTIVMAEALQSHGKDVETFIVPGATHYFTEQQNADARRRMFDFLRRHLNRG